MQNLKFLNFSDVQKNSDTVRIITDMIKSDKIPGAFIFEGEKESGKTLIANVLAKAIVCQNTEHKKKFGDSCGVCSSCLKAEKNIHPDIIISEPDGDGNLSFHIDKVREIINGLYLSPNESETKVYIIEDMQNMTPQGQNALLKSIEEPPPFAVFIITVNNSDLILETVKSRAVRFAMYSVNDAKNSKKDAERQYNEIIYDILAENPDRLATYQNLLSKIVDKSGKTDKTDAADFYSCLENALRDIMTVKIFTQYEDPENPENPDFPDISFLYFSGNDGFEQMKKLANLCSMKKILNLSKKIHKYKADLDYNINIRLNLTSFFSS